MLTKTRSAASRAVVLIGLVVMPGRALGELTPMDIAFTRQAARRLVFDAAQEIPLWSLRPSELVGLEVMHPIMPLDGHPPARYVVEDALLKIHADQPSRSALWMGGMNPFPGHVLTIENLVGEGLVGFDFASPDGALRHSVLLSFKSQQPVSVVWTGVDQGEQAWHETIHTFDGQAPAAPFQFRLQMLGSGLTALLHKDGLPQVVGQIDSLNQYLDLRRKEAVASYQTRLFTELTAGSGVLVREARAAIDTGVGLADLRAMTYRVFRPRPLPRPPPTTRGRGRRTSNLRLKVHFPKISGDASMCDQVGYAGKIGRLFHGLILGLSLMMPATRASADALDADLLLGGGTIYDGSGEEAVVGDVAVRDGRIVAVGKVAAGKIGRTIDCRGLIIAPGLIDLHTHSDGTISQSGVRPALNYLIQGCTTMGTGYCGGARDVVKFLEDIDTHGAGTNIIHLVGHGTIRRAVLGSSRAAPTAEELERMKALVGQAMRAGAWGMSTGLIYAPSSYAQTEELVALAKVVADHGGLYVSHIRDEGDHLLAAVEEAIEIGRRSGAPVHISHFKSMQIPNWGRVRKAAAMIEQARADGLTITADQYPYTANSFSLADATLPDGEIQGCSRADLPKRMASEPEFDALVRRVIADQLARTEKIVIAASKKFPAYVSKSLDEVAADEQIETVDLVLRIIAQDNPQIVSHSMSEADVRWVMTLPWVATASDGAARAPNPNEHHHPRNFGTFARKIGRFAIEEKLLPLPQAIRSATGLPADIFGISERGYLRRGYHADIVVFDPATYRDHATYDKPQEYATGVRYVFLAGQPAIDDGKASERLFGQALRHRSTAEADTN